MCFEKSHQIFMVHYWYWLYYAEKSNEFAGFIFSPMHNRGQTYKWRWRHLQAQVAPLLSLSGATSKFRWRHLKLQVAPPEVAGGAT